MSTWINRPTHYLQIGGLYTTSVYIILTHTQIIEFIAVDNLNQGCHKQY